MVSHLFFYQLVLVALVWLCVMLHWAWPSNPAPVWPATPESLPPRPKRTRAPRPFAGLTTKPHCAYRGWVGWGNLRASKFHEVVTAGVFYGQPHSEPVELGQTDTALTVGGRRFGTTARKVDGGYVLNGYKFFVSLAGAAHYYSTPALLVGEGPWLDRTLYLQVPRDAPGVTFQGEWDPLGMRGTVSRDMLLHDVFVPDEAEILPPGLFGALFNAYPHLPLSFSATFLGLMQAAYDYAIAYLTGKISGAPGLQSEAGAKGYAVAEMLFTLEAARALYYRVISEAQVQPPLAAVQRAR